MFLSEATDFRYRGGVENCKQVDFSISITILCGPREEKMALNTPMPLPIPINASNNFEDLSGVNTAAYENPYDALIEASRGDPVRPLSLLP